MKSITMWLIILVLEVLTLIVIIIALVILAKGIKENEVEKASCLTSSGDRLVCDLYK